MTAGAGFVTGAVNLGTSTGTNPPAGIGNIDQTTKTKMKMTLEKGHIYFGAACLIAGIVLGAGFRSCGKPTKPVPAEPVTIHDTICIRDTIKIAAKTRIISTTVRDTLIVRDTDTIVVTLPLETKEYRDTFTTDTSRIELGVRFSGYKAKIEGIDLTSQYTVQPRTIVKKKGWGQFVGIGIGVGYGASFVGHPSGVGTVVYAAPEVGVHITYGWGYHW